MTLLPGAPSADPQPVPDFDHPDLFSDGLEGAWANARAALAVEAADVGIYDWDVLADRLEWSPRLMEIFGLPPDAPVSYARLLQLTHPDDRHRLDQIVRECMDPAGPGIYRASYRIMLSDGRHRHIDARGRVFFKPDAQGKRRAIRFIGTAMDVTERVLAEIRERIGAVRLRLAMEAGGLAGWEFDPRAGRVWGSTELRRMFRLDTTSEGTAFDDYFSRVHPEDRALVQAALESVTEAGAKMQIQYRLLFPGPEIRWLSTRGEGLVDEFGDLRIVGWNDDITVEKEREAALRAALTAKEALLAEVNHRVKNSLQMVTSLFTLQSRRTDHPEVIRTLQEAAARITVIASVHQRLYQQGGHVRIQFGEYLRGMAADTLQVLDGKGVIRHAVEADPDLSMTLDRAVPLAMIAAELITNAVKYAFDDEGGVIRLVARGQEGGGLILMVEDQGRGLPEGFDAQGSSGLGMRIVTALAAQMNGRLSVEAVTSGGVTPGTRFTLTVPPPETAEPRAR